MKEFKFGVMMLSVLGNLMLSSTANADLKGNLSVEVDGLKNKEGQLCVNIFSSSRGFPSKSDRALQKQCVKITEIPVTVNFQNLKAGSYAVAAIHDTNGDRTLNRNDLGMPLEGFGFSLNPDVKTNAPKFGDAAFLLAGRATNIKIQFKYF
jgi:uncharacterized protein (DUF2141 family)